MMRRVLIEKMTKFSESSYQKHEILESTNILKQMAPKLELVV